MVEFHAWLFGFGAAHLMWFLAILLGGAIRRGQRDPLADRRLGELTDQRAAELRAGNRFMWQGGYTEHHGGEEVRTCVEVWRVPRSPVEVWRVPRSPVALNPQRRRVVEV